MEELERKQIKDYKLKISFGGGVSNSVTTKSTKEFKEDDKIEYNLPYEEHCFTHFIKAQGDDSLKFIEQKIIDKQRGVLTHFLSKIGSNLLSGSGIMNVSLPINIFDQRSLLELFAHQCRLSPYFLEKLDWQNTR